MKNRELGNDDSIGNRGREGNERKYETEYEEKRKEKGRRRAR